MNNPINLPSLPIEEYALENGLRVVLSQDEAVPVVSVAVYYDVGSRNEREGRSGFAHLFEHMMFQGSENVGKTEHFQFIMKAGGTMNGSTSEDRTNYYQTLPSNQLPLALWLESDRMRSLKVTEENFENQRQVVKEEKRLRYDNQPYINGILRLNEMVYKNFANSHSVIGSMDDLDAASVADVQEFFKTYYAPNNAVLSIVGSFDKTEARQLVEKFFASIPSQPKPETPNVEEPSEVAVNQETFEDKFAPLPAFLTAWKIPPRSTKDFDALTLAAKLLFDGDSSRLYQKLVKGEETVAQLFGSLDERRGPSALWIGAIPKPDAGLEVIRKSIFNEIEAMSTVGVTDEEMTKLHNGLLNDEIRGRQSSMYRAQRLAEAALYDGNPNVVNTEFQDKLKITKDEIKTAVATYLNNDNRATIDIVPAKDAKE
ncbi:MAG: insulinase family protein [Pyrinomonadaceae bacterium]|nr:insulinase family protein [Pyrinomonadaceae bacterium]